MRCLGRGVGRGLVTRERGGELFYMSETRTITLGGEGRWMGGRMIELSGSEEEFK